MRLRRLLALCLLLPLLAACGKDPQTTRSSTSTEGLSTPSTTVAPVSTPNNPRSTPSEAVLPPENTSSIPSEPVLTPAPSSAPSSSAEISTSAPSFTPTPTAPPSPSPVLTSTPAPTPTPAPAATPASQPIVPDVCAFLGARKNANSKHKYNATYEEYKEFPLSQYDLLRQELLNLLKNYSFSQLSDQTTQITDNTWQCRLDYAYTGSESIEAYSRSGYEGVHLSLLFTGYTQTDELAISYTYVDGLTLSDPGTRSAATASAASSSSSAATDQPEKSCWYCGGSGTCPTCRGSGTVRKWVAGTVNDYVDQSCTDCYSPGKCRMCGGSGHE